MDWGFSTVAGAFLPGVAAPAVFPLAFALPLAGPAFFDGAAPRLSRRGRLAESSGGLPIPVRPGELGLHVWLMRATARADLIQDGRGIDADDARSRPGAASCRRFHASRWARSRRAPDRASRR